jgi:hypothetical protein
MLQWTEGNASWSNCSTVATYKHADSASFSTRLQLMGEDVELGEPGRYCSGNPGPMAPMDTGAKAASPRAASLETPAPAIFLLAVPYGAPSASDTSVANITAAHRRMTGASKVQLLSSGHQIL